MAWICSESSPLSARIVERALPRLSVSPGAVVAQSSGILEGLGLGGPVLAGKTRASESPKMASVPSAAASNQRPRGFPAFFLGLAPIPTPSPAPCRPVRLRSRSPLSADYAGS